MCVILYEYVNSLFSTLSQRHAQRASRERSRVKLNRRGGAGGGGGARGVGCTSIVSLSSYSKVPCAHMPCSLWICGCDVHARPQTPRGRACCVLKADRDSGDEGAQKCRSGVVEQCAAKRNPITGNRDKVRITDLGLSGIICLNLYLWPSTVQKLHSRPVHC
jgi:hypothetical protein